MKEWFEMGSQFEGEQKKVKVLMLDKGKDNHFGQYRNTVLSSYVSEEYIVKPKT